MPTTRYATINYPTASSLEKAYALNQKKMNAIVAADMGTGCDTILAQMAADVLECAFDRIVVHGVDTDVSPYDSGSYASSTTYVTGMAVVKATNALRKMIIQAGAKLLSIPKEEADFDGEKVFEIDAPEHSAALAEISYAAQNFSNEVLSVSAANSSPVSPPYMVGMAEMKPDRETGIVKPIKYCAVADCGTVINENLVRVQAEGGIAPGIGMTLYEDVQYGEKGGVIADSLMQYKIPSRLDVGGIEVAFESSYEPTGPFDAKSIGEVVIITPLPAISQVIYRATGCRFYELPILPSQIVAAIAKKELMP